jgi:hypothetical protein
VTVHVKPINDAIPHDDSAGCICGPDVEYIDPDTGCTYPNGPLVIHHSLDGRETRESVPEASSRE